MAPRVSLSVPTIHQHGSPRKVLLRRLRDAYVAGHVFKQALEDAAPAREDFDVQGPNAFTDAAIEWVIEVDRIAALLKELLELTSGISKQPEP